MNHAKLFVFVLFLVTMGLVAALFFADRPESTSSGKPLMVFCAAGMKEPMTTIAKKYETEYKVPVQLQFGGSGSLLSSMQVAKGDIYLAADASYLDIAKEKNLVDEVIPVSFLTGGIGVPAGNPKNIKTLDDLKRDDVKIGFAVPEAASIGKFTKKILSKANLWDELEKKAHLTTPTVNDLANAIKLETIDAAIIWDAVANQYADIDFVHTPEFDQEVKQITMGILKSTGQPTAALRFARYATARDRGLPVFKKDGYQTLDGDIWKEHPDILLYSGGMLRPAITETIKNFEKREGVTIRPVFNGCGVLVSQMKAGENPDAYFSCDVKFMDMVSEKFDKPVTVTGNDMVILLKKGNPKKILNPTDLKRPGLKLGFAHPEKSALGYLTRAMLTEAGLYQAIVDADNIKLDSPTGDFLVNQLRAGSLDAIIVYRSNAKAFPATLEECEIVEVNMKGARAEQPYAVGKGSDFKNLMSRFIQHIAKETSQDTFKSLGFHWELN